jgi:chemotaxis response regulator CheB
MAKQDACVVVDDSALVRGLLAEIINRQPDMDLHRRRQPTRWWRAR